MKTYSYLSRLCDIFIDCGIVIPDSTPAPEFYKRLFGVELADSSLTIHFVRLVCKSWTFSGGRAFQLYIDYYVHGDVLSRRVHVFFGKPISDYKFRKLRKLLKEDGYIR